MPTLRRCWNCTSSSIESSWFFGLGAEAPAIDEVDDLVQDAAAADLVAAFTKDLADLEFDRLLIGGVIHQLLQVGK
jgi:hypothetical protein